MFPWSRARALEEALEALEEARREAAALRAELVRAKAEKSGLEREAAELRGEVVRLRERVEALTAEIDAFGDQAEMVERAMLDRVARALANKPGPAFAQDETGAWVASFPRGEGRVAAFRIAEGESRRDFRRRVWRAWLDHQLSKV